MSESSTRSITLQEKYSPRAYRQYKKVPELKISGVWLSAYGFQAGGKVEITVAEKQLIIKAL